MKTRKTASLRLLILLIGLGGCATPGSSPTASNSISISPTSAFAGISDLTLTILGSNFAGAPHNFSQAVWSVNGTSTLLATQFHTSTQLTAVVPAALLANSATAQVFIQTGDPMGDIPLLKSTSVIFPVKAAPVGAASIDSISPTSAAAGSPDLTISIMGSNFDGAGVIRSRAVWVVNGSTTPLSTTFVSDTLLTVVIPAALMTSPVEAQVAVQHYDNMEEFANSTSNSVTFSITSPGSSSISSGFVPAGSMSTARSGHTATLLLGGKVLVAGGDVGRDAGGNASAELFNPVNGTFTPTGSMNTWRYGATATLLPNGKVLIAGRFGPGVSELPRLNSGEPYDPLMGTFNAIGSMSLGRVLHTAVLLNDGRVLIAGGTTSDSLAATGDLVTARVGHTATLLSDGRVLVTGGVDSNGNSPASAELYK